MSAWQNGAWVPGAWAVGAWADVFISRDDGAGAGHGKRKRKRKTLHLPERVVSVERPASTRQWPPQPVRVIPDPTPAPKSPLQTPVVSPPLADFLEERKAEAPLVESPVVTPVYVGIDFGLSPAAVIEKIDAKSIRTQQQQDEDEILLKWITSLIDEENQALIKYFSSITK